MPVYLTIEHQKRISNFYPDNLTSIEDKPQIEAYNRVAHWRTQQIKMMYKTGIMIKNYNLFIKIY